MISKIFCVAIYIYIYSVYTYIYYSEPNGLITLYIVVYYSVKLKHAIIVGLVVTM